MQISLQQFRDISNGTYNAGQIDAVVSNSGKVSLKKVNNHVHLRGSNTATVDPQRALEIRQALVNALSTDPKVGASALAEIRRSLGLPEDANAPAPRSGRAYEALTRQQVREILDRYLPGDRPRAADSTKVVTARNEVNAANVRDEALHIGGENVRIHQVGMEEIGDVGLSAEAQREFENCVKGMLDILGAPGEQLDIAGLVRKMNTLDPLMKLWVEKEPSRALDTVKELNFALTWGLSSCTDAKFAAISAKVASPLFADFRNELVRRIEHPGTEAYGDQATVSKTVLAYLDALEARVEGERTFRTAAGDYPALLARLPQEESAALTREYGDNLERLPKALAKIIKEHQGTAARFFAIDHLRSVCDAAAITNVTLDRGRNILSRVARTLAQLDAGGVQDPARRQKLVDSVAKSSRSDATIDSVIRMWVVQDVMEHDLEKVVRETQEEAFPAALREELRELGVADGALASGDALPAIRHKIGDFIDIPENLVRNDNRPLDEVARDLRQRVVKPILETRLASLRALKGLAFTSPAEREATIRHATRMAKIANIEHMKGVYDSACGMVDELEKFLDEGGEADAPNRFTASVLRFMDRFRGNLREEGRVHKKNAFDIEDIDARREPAIKLALDFLRIRRGDAALVRLAQALTTPRMLGLVDSAFIVTSTSEHAEARSFVGSNVEDLIYIHQVLTDDLVARGSITFSHQPTGDDDYAHVAPQFRDALAVLMPETIAQLNNQHAYAPDTCKIFD